MSGTTAGEARRSLRAMGLFAETWFHRDPLAPLGAAAGNYFLAALGLHARAKAVYLRSLAPVGLECTLGQSSSLLLSSTVLGQTVSINHPQPYVQTAIGKPTVTRITTKDTKSQRKRQTNEILRDRLKSFVILSAFCGFCFLVSAAPSPRQLPSRHLTAPCIRVLNNHSRKIPSRTFPHNKKICATMPH